MCRRWSALSAQHPYTRAVGRQPAARRAGRPARRRLLVPPSPGSRRARRQDRRHLQRRHRHEPAHGAGARAHQPCRRTPGPAVAARQPRGRARVVGRLGGLGEHAHRRPGPPHDGDGARDWRRRQGRPVADHGARDRRAPARRRVPPHGHHRQHDGRPARVVRLRGHARGARGRHRRQAGGSGAGARRGRHLEGPHRQRQPDGRQPHRPGPQHRRGDHGRRQRRPDQEDRRRRQGRVPRTEEHHQHDGGPAPVVCLGSHARGARGRHGRQAGRPGARRRRVGHVEGPHRLGQLDGRQPHQPGPQHRRRHHRRRARRPLQADHRRRPGRDPRAEEHRQHDGRPALVVCRGSHARGARGRLGRQARRPGARRRRVGHVEGPHRLGQLDGRQPHRPGPQHRRRHHGRRQAAT